MDPDTACLALNLQLQDAENVLRTANGGFGAEAFRIFRAELLRTRDEFDDRCDHVMASELAGQVPIPRADLPEQPARDERSDIFNGNPERRFAIYLGVVQTGHAPPVEKSSSSSQSASVAPKEKTTESMNRESTARLKEQKQGRKPDLRQHGLSDEANARFSSSLNRDPKPRKSIGTQKIDSPTVEESKKATKQSLVPAALHDKDPIDTSQNEEATTKIPQKIASRVECSGCSEVLGEGDILQLSCASEGAQKHAYYRTCLQDMFEGAIADSGCFPPRCCDPLELFHCMPFFSEDLIVRFREKKEELGTPHRTYCSKAECGKWIKPVDIEAGVATCSTCAQETCTSCNAALHDGLCREDEDVKALLTLAEQRRWKSCPECKNMVELRSGCYHIT
ncbi:IBR finger domain-containing protein [Paraphaeosphaeria sporulosa]